MSDNRSKRSQLKEHHNWNIPPDMDTSGAHTKSKGSDMDSLFDSGYDSQTVSKTSIDLETEFEQKMSLSSSDCQPIVPNKKFESKKWTDSGLGITDSGLHIEEDFSDQKIEKDFNKRIDSKSIGILREAFDPDQDGDTYLHLSIIEGLPDLSYALIRIVPDPDFLDIVNHLFQV